MFENIYLTIVAALPSIAAVFTVIAAVVKMTKDNGGVLKEVLDRLEEFAIELKNTKEMDEMKMSMKALAQSNRELQKKYNELLTEITKVEHKEE